MPEIPSLGTCPGDLEIEKSWVIQDIELVKEAEKEMWSANGSEELTTSCMPHLTIVGSASIRIPVHSCICSNRAKFCQQGFDRWHKYFIVECDNVDMFVSHPL